MFNRQTSNVIKKLLVAETAGLEEKNNNAANFVGLRRFPRCEELFHDPSSAAGGERLDQHDTIKPRLAGVESAPPRLAHQAHVNSTCSREFIEVTFATRKIVCACNS